MLEKQKKCPEGQVSLHLNRKLFRRLPLDFHGKITLIDSPSEGGTEAGTVFGIIHLRRIQNILQFFNAAQPGIGRVQVLGSKKFLRR